MANEWLNAKLSDDTPVTAELRQAPFPSGGRLAGVKMGLGRLSTSIVSWVCEPADKLGAGARPGRVRAPG
jgi:hypothetical protein